MANEDRFHLGLKALIRNNKGEILVLKANVKTFVGAIPQHWDLPGGRIHKGETVEQALKREVKEEIGISKIKILELLDASISKIRISYEDSGLILFTYLCEITDSSQVKLTDDEHTEFIWCKPKKAAELLKTKFSDSLIEKIKKL